MYALYLKLYADLALDLVVTERNVQRPAIEILLFVFCCLLVLIIFILILATCLIAAALFAAVFFVRRVLVVFLRRKHIQVDQHSERVRAKECLRGNRGRGQRVTNCDVFA